MKALVALPRSFLGLEVNASGFVDVEMLEGGLVSFRWQL